MIYQKHPKHGLHMPVTATEAKENEKTGWKTVTEAEFYGITEEPERDIIAEYMAKFGKKPDGRLSDKRIIKLLDE